MTVAFGTADAATTSYTYDGDGRKLTETDPRGQTTGAHSTYTYDAAGRLTDVLDPVGRKTHYNYDGKACAPAWSITRTARRCTPMTSAGAS